MKNKASRSQSVFWCPLRRPGYQAAVRAVPRPLCVAIGRILDQRIGATGQRIESEPTLFIGRAKSLGKHPRVRVRLERRDHLHQHRSIANAGRVPNSEGVIPEPVAGILDRRAYLGRVSRSRIGHADQAHSGVEQASAAEDGAGSAARGLPRRR
jgi:hypothetical protein